MSERRRYTTFYVTSGLTDGWSKPCYVFHTESVCMIRQGVYNTFPRLPYKIMQFSDFLSLEKLYRLCEELLLTDSYSCGPSCEFGTCAEFHHCMCLSWFCSLWLLLSPFFLLFSASLIQDVCPHVGQWSELRLKSEAWNEEEGELKKERERERE